MKSFLRENWLLFSFVGLIGGFLSLVLVSTAEQAVADKRRKILDAELKLQAVRTGLGEFYVSTNTATIEFRLKPTP
jgi:hypothetical protein